MNLEQFADFELDGINPNDYPDFCDAFIISASFNDETKGWREANNTELDWLNEQTDFIYNLVLNQVF